uniref:Uncharacterized protein n=1 Tax=Sphaerodactylus townsendi TaxID=933632 RepID=A0ACB8ELT6_9SAUR
MGHVSTKGLKRRGCSSQVLFICSVFYIFHRFVDSMALAFMHPANASVVQYPCWQRQLTLTLSTIPILSVSGSCLSSFLTAYSAASVCSICAMFGDFLKMNVPWCLLALKSGVGELGENLFLLT